MSDVLVMYMIRLYHNTELLRPWTRLLYVMLTKDQRATMESSTWRRFISLGGTRTLKDHCSWGIRDNQDQVTGVESGSSDPELPSTREKKTTGTSCQPQD